MKKHLFTLSICLFVCCFYLTQTKALTLGDTIYLNSKRQHFKSILQSLAKEMDFKTDSNSCRIAYSMTDTSSYSYYKSLFKTFNREHKTNLFSKIEMVVTTCIDMDKNNLKDMIILEEWYFEDDISAKKAFDFLEKKKPLSMLGLENNSFQLLSKNKIFIAEGMLAYNKKDTLMLKIREDAEILLK